MCVCYSLKMPLPCLPSFLSAQLENVTYKSRKLDLGEPECTILFIFFSFSISILLCLYR